MAAVCASRARARVYAGHRPLPLLLLQAGAYAAVAQRKHYVLGLHVEADHRVALHGRGELEVGAAGLGEERERTSAGAGSSTSSLKLAILSITSSSCAHRGDGWTGACYAAAAGARGFPKEGIAPPQPWAGLPPRPGCATK